MPADPGSLTGLRRRNRREILDVVRLRGTTSRPDIARRTGLSPTTVSTLVAQLLDEAVVVELPDTATPPGGGRPARLLGLNPAGGGVVGVHLAHDHVRVAVTDLGGEVVTETVTDLDVDHRPSTTTDFVAAEAQRLIGHAGLRPEGVIGMGVAVSAPVTPGTRAVDSAVILPDWRDTDLAQELAHRVGIPVELGNDANLGAVAEHRFGAGQGVDDLVYVMVSDGVGAGLVLDGRLYHGAAGGAGELGHVTVDPRGFACRCGNRGCLETVAGARALSAALTLTHGAGTTAATIVAADRAGDDAAHRVMADAGAAVGRAVVPLCTVLDLGLVVVGGDFAASATLVDAVARMLDASVTPLRRQPVPVRAGALGERAELLGAVALATQRFAVT